MTEREPPIETPGPSVPPPLLPESDTERAEFADATKPDAEQTGARDPDAELVAEEESAAAFEARGIGGPVLHDADDPAFEAAYEAGGGEQDGWEQAERDLIENASHGDGHGNPLRDALAPELESDLSDAEYGDADHWEGPDDD